MLVICWIKEATCIKLDCNHGHVYNLNTFLFLAPKSSGHSNLPPSTPEKEQNSGHSKWACVCHTLDSPNQLSLLSSKALTSSQTTTLHTTKMRSTCRMKLQFPWSCLLYSEGVIRRGKNRQGVLHNLNYGFWHLLARYPHPRGVVRHSLPSRRYQTRPFISNELDNSPFTLRHKQAGKYNDCNRIINFCGTAFRWGALNSSVRSTESNVLFRSRWFTIAEQPYV